MQEERFEGERIERVRCDGKRMFTLAYKRWVVGQCGRAGVSVAGLALANGINANVLRRWIVQSKEATEGEARLVPVTIAPPGIRAHGERQSWPDCRAGGSIELEIGQVRVKLQGEVEEVRLRTVLKVLGIGS